MCILSFVYYTFKIKRFGYKIERERIGSIVGFAYQRGSKKTRERDSKMAMSIYIKTKWIGLNRQKKTLRNNWRDVRRVIVRDFKKPKKKNRGQYQLGVNGDIHIIAIQDVYYTYIMQYKAG